jgi:hypothetical protein
MLLKNDVSSVQTIQCRVFAITECSEKETFMRNHLQYFGMYNSIIHAWIIVPVVKLQLLLAATFQIFLLLSHNGY